MKNSSNSNCFYSKSRLLLGLIIILLSGLLLLAGIGSMSSTFAARLGSPKAGQSNSSALPSSNNFGSKLELVRRFDQRGNRVPGMSSLPLHQRHTRAIRPTGSGNWSSLGPPGGDVFDAAVSTTDANIALAGIAPDGSVGGVLYRSTDAGYTWSE